MFFEDEEFSDKKNESLNVTVLNIDNDIWTIKNGILEEYKDFDSEEVRVPDGVTVIQPYVFAFNGSLKSIYIPKSVQRLESDAIVENLELIKIYIENENIEIIEGAIAENVSLEEVYIGGKKVDYIIAKSEDKGELSFEIYLGEDKEFVIPDGVKMINTNAFEFCEFERLYVPDSVREISHGAFSYCNFIKEFKVPPYVEYMGVEVFKGWTEEQTIYVPQTFKKMKFLQRWRNKCKAQIIYY